jgi:hypothetical protein
MVNAPFLVFSNLCVFPYHSLGVITFHIPLDKAILNIAPFKYMPSIVILFCCQVLSAGLTILI